MTSDRDSSGEMQEARYEGLPSREELTDARQIKQMLLKEQERIKHKLKDEGRCYVSREITETDNQMTSDRDSSGEM
ncbi:MAG: hypothetical protein GY823_02175 [Flavobacteriaceae bacterium]|nr:hypothetical protein [Flavobacteriaceae bacterium]